MKDVSNFDAQAPAATSHSASGTRPDEFTELMQDNSRMFGQRREATLLFADLRRFSNLSATLAHEAVYELLGHVMDCLTTEVIAHDGVVIDYLGDGLAAMWNAPTDQADHAERACRAALGMLESLPTVDSDWADLLEGAKLRLGVGLHTGIVQVGNSGSRRVKKYGPRGATVHLASRVEAATKAIGVPLLLTGSTVSRLSDNARTYRICRAELPGIDEPVDLFGLLPKSAIADESSELDSYSRGLTLLEAGELKQAKTALTAMPLSDTLPNRFLLQYVEHQLGQQNRRRSGDQSESRHRGVIRIDVK